MIVLNKNINRLNNNFQINNKIYLINQINYLKIKKKIYFKVYNNQ